MSYEVRLLLSLMLLLFNFPTVLTSTSPINLLKFLYIIELSFNSKEFGRVLLVTRSMFGKLEVHASEVVLRFEPITFYMRELRGKLILAPHAKLK